MEEWWRLGGGTDGKGSAAVAAALTLVEVNALNVGDRRGVGSADWAEEPAENKLLSGAEPSRRTGSTTFFFCQGEGRGFESRRPLHASPAVSRAVAVSR